MKAKTDDDTYLFHSSEVGCRGQCYFLHEKTRKEEAEQWLDKCFNGILQQYRADKCRNILGGETHVRRDNQVRDSSKIMTYLQGLNLTAALTLRRRDDHLQASPVKKTKAYPRIQFGKVQPENVWKNLHATEEAPSKAKEKPTKKNDLAGGQRYHQEWWRI